MKISVAMCTYNGAEFLPAQLESIAAQTRPPDEIVVCDDSSSDDTESVLKRFSGLVLHSNKQNLGSVKNFEQAIRLCTGDIVALSDQDDVWRADKLQLIEDAFRKTPAAGLVFSDAEIVDENLNPLGRRMWNEVGFDSHKRKLVDHGRALDVLITGWTVTGAAMAFRSEYKNLSLPIPTTVPMIHDGWIALTIAAVADVVTIDEPLIKYRQHARQQIGAPGRKTEQAGTRDALKRRNPNADLHHTLDTLRQRLLAHKEQFDCLKALEFVNNYSRHLDARANLPQRRLNRVPTILRELLTWRYHEYANGFKSAAKDLVS
ncbi:MAG TPA: glycosyltransferase family 2 protein [Pyrinomonadaceae bacterium]|nr:glycosyltransferase family 2 protein [Pyrinomonadaceae bacterium]